MLPVTPVAFAKMLGWTKEEVAARFKEIKEGEGSYYNKNTKKRTSNYMKSRAYPFLKELTQAEIDEYLAGYEWNELHGDKKSWD